MAETDNNSTLILTDELCDKLCEAAYEKSKEAGIDISFAIETDRLAHSLSVQEGYYNKLIQSNPEWEFAGVYAEIRLVLLIQSEKQNSCKTTE